MLRELRRVALLLLRVVPQEAPQCCSAAVPRAAPRAAAEQLMAAAAVPYGLGIDLVSF